MGVEGQQLQQYRILVVVGAAAAAAAAKSLQLCLTLCDPRDGSPPSSSVPGILQARVLEWGASAFSRVNHYLSVVITSYQ